MNKMKYLICSGLILLLSVNGFALKFDLNKLTSPVLFWGNETTAYRDPAVLLHDGTFYLFFTLVETEPDDKIYSYTAISMSSDLVRWTDPEKLTEKNQNLDFSSPGIFFILRMNGFCACRLIPVRITQPIRHPGMPMLERGCT